MLKTSFYKYGLISALALQSYFASNFMTINSAAAAEAVNMSMIMGPYSVGNVRKSAAGKNSYVIKVTTNNPAILKGYLVASSPSTNSAHRTMSISTKANDFNVPSNCKRDGSSNVVVNWSYTSVFGACILERNKTYYINIAHHLKGDVTCFNGSGCDFYFNAKAVNSGLSSTPVPMPVPTPVPVPAPTPKPVPVPVPTSPVVERYDAVLDWPGPSDGNIIRTAINMNSYIIKTLTNNEAVSAGQVSAYRSPSNSAYRTIAISRIPGDFNVSKFCKSGSSVVAVVRWSHDRDVYGSCELQRGVTYYINVSHRLGDMPTCQNQNGCDFSLKASGY